MLHPHTTFVVALGIVGPFLAMAGVSLGGVWGAIGVGVAGAVVALAAWRSTAHSYRDRGLHALLRWRMMIVTVTVAAAAVAVGSIVWLARYFAG